MLYHTHSRFEIFCCKIDANDSMSLSDRPFACVSRKMRVSWHVCSIADGESFLVIFHVFLYLSEIILASLATKNFLNQLPTLYKQQIQI